MESISNYIEEKKKKFEPTTPYEFCQVFASITKLPIGKFLKDTQGWPMSWFYDVKSLCQYEKDKTKHAVIINSFIKKAKCI